MRNYVGYSTMWAVLFLRMYFLLIVYFPHFLTLALKHLVLDLRYDPSTSSDKAPEPGGYHWSGICQLLLKACGNNPPRDSGFISPSSVFATEWETGRQGCPKNDVKLWKGCWYGTHSVNSFQHRQMLWLVQLHISAPGMEARTEK